MMKHCLPLLVSATLLAAEPQTLFLFPFPPGFDPLTDETGSFSLVPVGQPEAEEGGLRLRQGAHARVEDAPGLTPHHGFQLSFQLRADRLDPDYNAAVLSHYAFKDRDDRSWFVGEQDGVLMMTLSPDGKKTFQFPSGLRMKTGKQYDVKVWVKIDPKQGGAVRWSWKTKSETTWHKETWKQEPDLTKLHDSSADLLLGALTKNGKADNFWDGWIDEIEMKVLTGTESLAEAPRHGGIEK